jgi:DNA-binding MarR family transcriptional regulator
LGLPDVEDLYFATCFQGDVRDASLGSSRARFVKLRQRGVIPVLREPLTSDVKAQRHSIPILLRVRAMACPAIGPLYVTERERRISRGAAAVRADLAHNGFGDVAPSHSALLRNIGEDGSRPSDLAAQAGVPRQAITKLVDELERLDLVRRDPDPDDGRGVIVRYTSRVERTSAQRSVCRWEGDR